MKLVNFSKAKSQGICTLTISIWETNLKEKGLVISFQILVLFSGRLLGFKFCNQRKGKKKKKNPFLVREGRI